jgi:hypothetical protein
VVKSHRGQVGVEIIGKGMLSLTAVHSRDCKERAGGQHAIYAFQSDTMCLTDGSMRVRSVISILAGFAALSVTAGDFEFVVIGDTRPRFESENFRLFEGLL